MTNWFMRLPIHRKLVAMALLVTAAALTLTTVGVVVLDAWRYRTEATTETTALAQVIAENLWAAVQFNDSTAATSTLQTVRVRPTIERACLYLPDGSLFAAFARAPLTCDPHPPGRTPWMTVEGAAAVTNQGELLGMVYVDRTLEELRSRVGLAAAGGFGMLVLAGLFAYVLAQRLHRTVSRPLSQLAAAARSIGPERQQFTLPSIEAPPDDVGDLVRAFTGMVDRVRDTNRHLVDTNEALRLEVAERRRVEAEREALLVREREASRLKDEFLAAVSHELRTPLNAIVGWTQVLVSSGSDADTLDKAIASIARNAQAQKHVIEDLLDVSRIVTGHLRLRCDAIDMAGPIEDALDIVRPAADAKRLRVDVDLAAGAVVYADRDRIQQIAWNLLSNAVKFTPPEGRIRVELRSDALAHELVVADSGVGIEPGFLKFVFDRFRQADGSMSREQGGLGLGLAIVKQLCELHGAEVSAASDGAGRGATFVVRVPRFDERRHEPGGERPQPEPPSLDGLAVLVVDDNPDALDVMAATLRTAGAVVQLADGGLEAVDAWMRSPADVLVCDLAMPRFDGCQVLQAIRTGGLEDRRVAAIAVTAHVSQFHRDLARRAGFDGHMAKPYEAADLIRMVATVAGRI
jgi:signal transduction histidine kinase